MADIVNKEGGVFTLSKLKYNKKNPRNINADKLANLKDKINEFPKFLKLRPIIYDPATMEVLGGNQRLRALRELGYKQIPKEWVKSANELTEEEKDAFIVIDNVSDGEWEFDVLIENWGEEKPKEWGVEFPEFEEEVHLGAKEDEYEAKDIIHTDIVKGDLFEFVKGDLKHRLLCGDSTDSDNIEKLLNKNKVGLIFTDPPYEIESKEIYLNFNLHDNCNVLIFASDKQVPFIFEASIGEFKRAYILDTGIASPTNNDVYVNHILLLRFKRGDAIKFNNLYNSGRSILKTDYRKNIKDDKTPHKHQKSLTTLGLFIQYWSNENSVVLDSFLGSGSTMVASHQLKRKCYGMELDPKYCQVIVDRMLTLDKDIKLIMNGKDVTKKYRDKLL